MESYPFQHMGSFFFLQLRYQSSQDAEAGLTSYNMNIANTVMYCAITFIAQGNLGKYLLVFMAFLFDL